MEVKNKLIEDTSAQRKCEKIISECNKTVIAETSRAEYVENSYLELKVREYNTEAALKAQKIKSENLRVQTIELNESVFESRAEISRLEAALLTEKERLKALEEDLYLKDVHHKAAEKKKNTLENQLIEVVSIKTTSSEVLKNVQNTKLKAITELEESITNANILKRKTRSQHENIEYLERKISQLSIKKITQEDLLEVEYERLIRESGNPNEECLSE